MRIAILTSGFLPVVDGVTVAVSHRLRHLSSLGHSVLVLCPSYEAIATVYPNWRAFIGDWVPGVDVVGLPSEPFMEMTFERNVSSAAYAKVLTELTDFKPDVIHVDEPDRMFLGFGKLPAVEWAQDHGVPCFAFYHTNFLEYMEDFFPLPLGAIAPLQWAAKKAITCRVFNAYKATLTASPTTYQKIQQYGIRNGHLGQFLGVDLETFKGVTRQIHFWRSYGLPELDRPEDPNAGRIIKLLFIGRLTPDKGWGFTLKALEQWPTNIDRKSVAFIIAGDGSLRLDLEAALKQLGFRVHLLGRVAPEAVPSLLTHSDIHVTTSVKETWGLTALEASAAGIPVLAPGAGGLLDTVQNGQTGLHFAPGNATDFLEKLMQLVQSPELRHSLGEAGKTLAAQYSWRQATENLLAVWGDRPTPSQPTPTDP